MICFVCFVFIGYYLCKLFYFIEKVLYIIVEICVEENGELDDDLLKE